MIIELEMVLKRPTAPADSGLTARDIWPGKGRKKEEWLWMYILKPDKKGVKKSGSGDILAYFSLDALLDEWIELPF